MQFSKITIYIITFFYHLQSVILTNYISFKLIEVDDCVRFVNISNHIVFSFLENNTICDTGFTIKGPCDAGHWESYVPDDFLVKDYEYDFMTGVEITFEDWNRLNGFMAIDVYLNEYLIKYSDQSFWECKNCLNSHYERGKFDYGQEESWKTGSAQYPNVFRFHPRNISECGPDFYTFVFKINNINDLYKGGINGSFEIVNDYYTFSDESQIIIEKEVNYSRNNIELELINFNLDDIIYSKSNRNLIFKNENNDFIYKICIEDKEGHLKGLEPYTGDQTINSVDCFLETSGLNYTLGPNEKKNNYTEVKLKISVFKNCPENIAIYPYCNHNSIIEEKEFIFQIKINRLEPENTEAPTDSTEETAKTPDSTEQANTPDDSTEETTKPSDSTEQTTTADDSTGEISKPSDSTEQTGTSADSTEENTTPSDSSKQTTAQDDSTTQIAKPSDSSEQTTTSHDSTEQMTKSSDSADQTTTSHDSTEQVTKPSDSSEQVTTPSESTKQTTIPSDSTKQITTPVGSSEEKEEASDSIKETTTSSINEDQTEESSTTHSSIKVDILDCLDKHISHDDKNDVYSHLCINFTTNDILDNMEEVVNKIDENKTYKIIGKDFIAQVVPIDYLNENNTENNNEIFANLSHSNFTECEKILRDYYKIESPRKITFIQVELNNTEEDILVNQIEYQVYDDKQKLLNLSLCNITNLTIYYTLKNDKLEEVDLIANFKKSGIDILDLKDKFFNDVCLPYSDSENDLTLNDRIKDIYKNYSFCEKNCRLIDINFEEYKATCDCTIKENMNVTNFNFDFEKVLEEKQNNNFKIIKCHNGFTSIKDNLNNLGFWIFLGLMLLNILLLILYIYGMKSIKNYISQEMASHGYIGKSGQAFCHNYVKQLEKLIQRLNNMKNDFLRKKEPPKKKSKKKSRKNSEKKRSISFKNTHPNDNKEKLGSRIKLLKSKMNKTKRVTNVSNTKESVVIYNKKGNKNYVENNNFQLNLININVNEVKKKTYIPNLSEQVLNIYSFKEAIVYDKRSFFTIYYIFLIAKQVIMHAIFYKSPVEPLPIRLSLLKFMLGCDLALNAIFYTDDKVSEKYNSAKSVITFAFTNNLNVILLSTLIGYIMFIFLANLNNSTNQIRNLFREEEEKIKNNKNYVVSLPRKKEIIFEVNRIMKNYKIKIIIFYIIEFACMIFFWYYVTIFCNIYKKTQLSWLIDCLITIIVGILIDFLLNIILALLYKISIVVKSNCLYRVMIFFYCFS